jgi:hypothetical protein
MKIKGLIWGAALWAPMALGSAGLRADEIDLVRLMGDDAGCCDACCDAGCCDSGCCDDACCDACGEGCCDACGCCFDPYFFAAAEFMFLGIDANSGGRGNVYFQSVAGDQSLLGAEGYEDFTYAPRLTLGRQLSENWGIAGRFFYLSDDEYRAQGQLAVNGLGQPVAPSAGLTSEDDARLYTIDVVAIRSIQGEVWKVDALAGVQHAQIDINSDLQGIGTPVAGALQVGTSSTGSNFDGTGLTTGLIGRRQLGNSAAHLFASARGSLLWGESDTRASVLALAERRRPGCRSRELRL